MDGLAESPTHFIQIDVHDDSIGLIGLMVNRERASENTAT
jgi:hypothetical protein